MLNRALLVFIFLFLKTMEKIDKKEIYKKLIDSVFEFRLLKMVKKVNALSFNNIFYLLILLFILFIILSFYYLFVLLFISFIVYLFYYFLIFINYC